jgi:phosphoglycerate dehydrogenase-like enzyme
MRLLLPDRPEARALDLPSGVEPMFYDASRAPAPEQLAGVEFVVLDPPVADGTVDAVAAAGDVRVVQTLSAGVDFIAGRLPSRVALCDAAGVHDASVAEWVAAVLLAAAKKLPELLDAQRAGDWEHRELDDVEGMTVLILGHGSIGAAVEKRLAPFGVGFVRVARRGRDGVHAIDELPARLGDADAVVVLVPLTDETRGLLDEAALARMKPGALLINAARGPVVDTDALVAALRERRIRAALDVTDPEPLPAGHPLWSAPGLILTPHVAGDVPSFPRRGMELVADQVRRHVAGEPLRNVVSDGY